jgi:hypothetical protein
MKGDEMRRLLKAKAARTLALAILVSAALVSALASCEEAVVSGVKALTDTYTIVLASVKTGATYTALVYKYNKDGTVSPYAVGGRSAAVNGSASIALSGAGGTAITAGTYRVEITELHNRVETAKYEEKVPFTPGNIPLNWAEMTAEEAEEPTGDAPAGGDSPTGDTPAGDTPTDYGISLSESGTHDFPPVNAGYAEQPSLSVTITNTGNQPTGSLTVALTGANSGAFTVTPPNPSSIAEKGGTAAFTVRPNSGLAAGSYAATVTVSGGSGGSSAPISA